MIEVREGSILEFEGDCIVNPANSFMRHGGGFGDLAAIIDRAAQAIGFSVQTGRPDPERQKAAAQYRATQPPLTPTGGVGVSTAGVLPFKGIIHAVGPIYGGGEYLESNLLASAHQRAFHAAYERGWRSIAFPAISCGIFGYPADEAAKLAIHVAKRWDFLGEFDTIAFYPLGYKLQYNDALETVL